jgi:uncharacterized membrane protein YfcA
MTPTISFFIIALIVGFVTAGLKIQFDRFFAIILLISLMGLSVAGAVNTFLWIVFLSAGYVLWKNREKIKGMPQTNKKKFLSIIPLLAFVGVYAGSVLFSHASGLVLSVTVGVLAVLYGLRLVFIHFKSYEFEYKNEKPIYQKICGLFGPVVSGFFAGFIGTTLKPLKIPFAVKIGKMNMGQVYLGNTITAFYSSIFAIILHSFYTTSSMAMTANNVLLGIPLWLAIHIIYEVTQLFFKETWRKPFQIFIGLVLIIVAFKFF